MRLAVSTVAFPGVPPVELPGRVRALGVDGLALTVSDHGSLAADAPRNEIEAFRNACREKDVTVSAVYGYAGRGMLAEAGTRLRDIELAKRCIDLAAHLQAPLCRLFAGTSRGTDDVIDRFVEACEPVAVHAAGSGVKIGLPTHHDLAFDPVSCRRLIEGLGRHRAGIVFNGPSMELDGIDPVGALGDMIGLVEQVELKDWRRVGGHDVPVPLGSGEAKVMPVVGCLAGAGFEGWMTLHHLKQHHPELPELTAAEGGAVRSMYAASRKHG